MDRGSSEPGEHETLAHATAWYGDGLSFDCTGCGRCCRRDGYVWVGPRDVARLANALGLSVEGFRARYTREVAVEGLAEPGVSLTRGPDGCVFLDGATNRCTVYDVRPPQCRTFPFWPSTLESGDAWRREVVDLCGPEAFPEGSVVPAETIRSILRAVKVVARVAPRDDGTAP